MLSTGTRSWRILVHYRFYQGLSEAGVAEIAVARRQLLVESIKRSAPLKMIKNEYDSGLSVAVTWQDP